VIEAQSMQRLVIAADHGGAAETVEHGVTGFLVPPTNPEALAAMLDHALALPEPERLAIGKAARSSVCRSYTTAAMQSATLAIYDELLSDAPV
jgi:glycosyltransferase involved in cell wall biosynthesis